MQNQHRSHRPKPKPGKPTTHPVGYLKETSQTELAIQAIEIGIKAEYEKQGKPVPSPDQLRFLAEERYKSSIKNGIDNHLGTAEPIRD